MLKRNLQSMKIEVIHLEEVELDEVEEDSAMEESSLTKNDHHSQSVIFVKEATMLRKIVGSKGSFNASIVKKLGMLKNIVDLRTINKQVVLRRNRLMKTCFMLVILVAQTI